jgi:uncharacterized OB-fold protein
VAAATRVPLPEASSGSRCPFRPGLLQLEPPRLLGSRCSACGTTTFPARAFCPHCRATTGIDGVALTPDGHVHSFTVVRQAPAGVDVPYVLAQIDLGDGVRVLAQVVGAEPERIALGAPVSLELAPVADAAGQPDGQLVGYRFRVDQEMTT